MNINDFNIKNLTTISIVQEIKNGVRLVPDIIKPGIQGIFYAAGGALFNANSGLREEKSIGNRRLFVFHGIGNKSREDMNQKISRRSMASMLNF